MTETTTDQGSIKKYTTPVVIEHWLFFFLGFWLVMTAVPTFINSALVQLHIYDIILPTPFDSTGAHKTFGVLLVLLSLFHVFYHSRHSDRELLSSSPGADFKEFLHSLMFMIGLSRRASYVNDEKFSGIQRVTYLSLVYAGGLSLATGVMLILDSPDPDGLYLESGVLLTHVLTSIMIFFIVLFHIIIALRKKNWIGMRAIFLNKALPVWFIKKYHRNWYDELVNQGSIEPLSLGNQLRLEYDSEQPETDI